MASWPSYAGLRVEGFAEVRESAVERTEMESGPPKQARVRSRVMVRREVVVYLETKADYVAFVAWFRDSIAEGADWFTWTDPVDGASKQARVVAGEGLRAQPSPGLRYWTIPLMIETWG